MKTKAQSLPHRLVQLAGACFGLLNLRRPRFRRSLGTDAAAIISGPQGIYFLPREVRLPVGAKKCAR